MPLVLCALCQLLRCARCRAARPQLRLRQLMAPTAKRTLLLPPNVHRASLRQLLPALRVLLRCSMRLAAGRPKRACAGRRRLCRASLGTLRVQVAAAAAGRSRRGSSSSRLRASCSRCRREVQTRRKENLQSKRHRFQPKLVDVCTLRGILSLVCSNRTNRTLPPTDRYKMAQGASERGLANERASRNASCLQQRERP